MPVSPPAAIAFASAVEFRDWLERHHATESFLVVRIAKAHAANRGVTYPQALDQALCYGWIDGVRHRLDADHFTIRFSPRKAGSIWSRVNVRHVERLLKAGQMHPSGIRVYQARTAARTGVYSFERKSVSLGREFLARFKAHPDAWSSFNSEAPWYRRTAAFWVMNAKRQDTRERRLAHLIECSGKGLHITPLRRSIAPPETGNGRAR